MGEIHLDAAVLCVYLLVVRMLRSQRNSLPLAVIFMSPYVVSQSSMGIWVWPRESWIHWTMGCGVLCTDAG